jgi:hypothetical protein
LLSRRNLRAPAVSLTRRLRLPSRPAPCLSARRRRLSAGKRTLLHLLLFAAACSPSCPPPRPLLRHPEDLQRLARPTTTRDRCIATPADDTPPRKTGGWPGVAGVLRRAALRSTARRVAVLHGAARRGRHKLLTRKRPRRPPAAPTAPVPRPAASKFPQLASEAARTRRGPHRLRRDACRIKCPTSHHHPVCPAVRPRRYSSPHLLTRRKFCTIRRKTALPPRCAPRARRSAELAARVIRAQTHERALRRAAPRRAHVAARPASRRARVHLRARARALHTCTQHERKTWRGAGDAE